VDAVSGRINEVREPLRTVLVRLINCVASHEQGDEHEAKLRQLIADYRRFAHERCGHEAAEAVKRRDLTSVEKEMVEAIRLHFIHGYRDYHRSGFAVASQPSAGYVEGWRAAQSHRAEVEKRAADFAAKIADTAARGQTDVASWAAAENPFGLTVDPQDRA
jgi:hypothetical protein